MPRIFIPLSPYPETVKEVLDPPVKFGKGTIEAVKALKEAEPYKGNVEERVTKLTNLHNKLCEVYQKHTKIEFKEIKRGKNAHSFTSCYSPMSDTITMIGKLSIITYLHEFAHALGKTEFGAVRWSTNLFREVFPEKFGLLTEERSSMIKK
jgi:hypothetical protein